MHKFYSLLLLQISLSLCLCMPVLASGDLNKLSCLITNLANNESSPPWLITIQKAEKTRRDHRTAEAEKLYRLAFNQASFVNDQFGQCTAIEALIKITNPKQNKSKWHSILTQALPLFAHVYGKDSYSVAQCKMHLAYFELQNNHYSKAQVLICQSLAILERLAFNPNPIKPFASWANNLHTKG